MSGNRSSLVWAEARVVPATSGDKTLTAAVDEGRFRQDLYFRLNAMTIVLPPLRERLDDLPLLVDHFLRVHCAASSKRTRTLSDEAQEALQRYAWPGNVRELSHVLERAIVLSDGPRIDLTDLPAHVAAPTAPATAPDPGKPARFSHLPVWKAVHRATQARRAQAP